MSKLKSDILLIAITAAWGASFILMKRVAGDVSPYMFMAWRFLLAFLILSVVFFKRLEKVNIQTVIYSAILGVVLITYMLLQIVGLKMTSASNSAFITATSVLIVPFMSSILLKRIPTLSNLAGLALAFSGIFFMTGGVKNTLGYGDLLTFFGAVFVAFHIILADIFTKKEDGLTMGIMQNLFAGAYAFVFWAVAPGFRESISAFDNNFLISVSLTALLCTAFAFTAQIYVQQFVEPTRISIIFLLEPVFALLFALFISDGSGNLETLSFLKVAGVTLVITGALISELNLIKLKKTD